METKIYLAQIAIILLFTKLFSMLSKKVNLPQVIGAIFAGILLGPIGLNLLHTTETIEVLAEFGVILLMFLAGMETDLRELKKSFRASFIIAALGVAVPIFSGYALASFIFHEPAMESIFLGIVLSATSVSITVETLNEMGKLKSPAGTAILGAAIIDDILGIVLLSAMINAGQSQGSLLSSAGISIPKLLYSLSSPLPAAFL